MKSIDLLLMFRHRSSRLHLPEVDYSSRGLRRGRVVLLLDRPAFLPERPACCRQEAEVLVGLQDQEGPFNERVRPSVGDIGLVRGVGWQTVSRGDSGVAGYFEVWT